MGKFNKYWLPVISWGIFIFYVSSLTGSDMPGLFPKQDVIFHFFEYAVLSFLLYRAICRAGSNCGSLNGVKEGSSLCFLKTKRIYLVVFFCLLYAFSDELHQRFVPGRYSSIADLVVDSFGILFGSIVYRLKKDK